jgi:phosphorylcholine metabolism protein LicD
MDYGTLLGAVRNQGIVPHDKDADLGMEGHQWEMLLNYRPEIPWRDGKTTFRPTLIREIDGFQWVLKKPRTTSNRARYEFSGGHSLKIRASKKNHTNVDIFPWYLDARNRYGRKRYISCDRFKGRDFHKDKLLPLTTLMWEGRMLPAPRDAEWMCAHRYGGAWQTPLRRNNDGMIR